MSGIRTNSGNRLNKKWNVGANHALYHKDGNWYMPLERFPGAYFDACGYILFRSKEEYLTSKYLKIGERVHIPDSISKIPGYKKNLKSKN